MNDANTYTAQRGFARRGVKAVLMVIALFDDYKQGITFSLRQQGLERA